MWRLNKVALAEQKVSLLVCYVHATAEERKLNDETKKIGFLPWILSLNNQTLEILVIPQQMLLLEKIQEK